ncbi:glycosyltransferase [Candidatus Saccharibacteria bacterium]|nr:MAG: glycosyltransferase [Candidatus Saccharibacteria bacterium]
MRKARLHVVGLPHTQVNPDYISCAYTSKHYKFCNMMTNLGYEVFSYAGEHSTCDAYEHVVINTDIDQERWFGKFNYHENFYPITWEPYDIHWVESNLCAISKILQRIRRGDIICLIGGTCQEQIAKEFPYNPVVEYGIGYNGSFADFRVFESYSHMHWTYGGVLQTDNGRHYDAVIPNFFEPSHFTPGLPKEDYYVFLGRFIRRKGIEIAVEATRKLGAKLVMAGQGCIQEGNRFLGEDIIVEGDHLEHIGHVDVSRKAELLAKAKACFMPTLYIEPFGGVAVEALMSGTPVVASDFGAFTETVRVGLDGYRFRTVGEAAKFASDEMIKNLPSPTEISVNTRYRYSTEVVAKKYDDYFNQVIGAFYGEADFFSDFAGDPFRYLS